MLTFVDFFFFFFSISNLKEIQDIKIRNANRIMMINKISFKNLQMNKMLWRTTSMAQCYCISYNKISIK